MLDDGTYDAVVVDADAGATPGLTRLELAIASGEPASCWNSWREAPCGCSGGRLARGVILAMKTSAMRRRRASSVKAFRPRG